MNLSIEAGQIFGVLGPNGAGKTTLIKMLCTLILPTTGTATVGGCDLSHDAARVRALVGLVTGDERSFYWRLTGRQNLDFFAALHNLSRDSAKSRVAHVLEQVELAQDADRLFQNYSTGMRQRLAIARGLLHDPAILFLDEPTKGLDPLSTAHLHTLVADELVARQGKTIWLTTHRLDEAEKLCHRLAIMDHGKIRAVGTLPELKRLFSQATHYVVRTSGVSHAVILALQHSIGLIKIETRLHDDLQIEFSCDVADNTLARVIGTIVQGGGQIHEIKRMDTPLEHLFARAVGATEETHA